MIGVQRELKKEKRVEDKGCCHRYSVATEKKVLDRNASVGNGNDLLCVYIITKKMVRENDYTPSSVSLTARTG